MLKKGSTGEFRFNLVATNGQVIAYQRELQEQGQRDQWQATHGQSLNAVLGDGRQGLGDHPIAGEPGTAVLAVGGRVEPQRARPSVSRGLARWCGCPPIGGGPPPPIMRTP
jgi:hypothetical protein